MQVKLNVKIKYRESFRPFAPSVWRESQRLFRVRRDSPFMLLVAPGSERGWRSTAAPAQDLWRWYAIPGATFRGHARGLLRALQTVHREDTPRYPRGDCRVEAATGCAALLTPSFNVRASRSSARRSRLPVLHAYRHGRPGAGEHAASQHEHRHGRNRRSMSKTRSGGDGRRRLWTRSLQISRESSTKSSALRPHHSQPVGRIGRLRHDVARSGLTTPGRRSA